MATTADPWPLMWSAKEVALHGTLHEMPPSDIAEDWDATLFYCDLVSVERVAYVLSALFTVKRVLLVNFTKQRRHEPFPHFMISSLRRGYPPCHPHIRKATVPADTYLIGQDAGEVGHGSNTSVACSSLHFLLDRSLDRILEGCSKLHYIQAHTQLLGTEPTYTLPTQLSYTEARHYTDTKTKACILPSTRVIRRGHNADALVRMAFWYLLSEYKQCDGTAFIRNDRLARYANHTIRCRGSHLHMNTCMHNYSIAIAMENKSERGYVSEKLFNALLANTVPVYFGALQCTSVHRIYTNTSIQLGFCTAMYPHRYYPSCDVTNAGWYRIRRIVSRLSLAETYRLYRNTN